MCLYIYIYIYLYVRVSEGETKRMWINHTFRSNRSRLCLLFNHQQQYLAEIRSSWLTGHGTNTKETSGLTATRVKTSDWSTYFISRSCNTMIHSSGYMTYNQSTPKFLAFSTSYLLEDTALSRMSRNLKLSMHVVRYLDLYIDRVVQFKSKTARHCTLSAFAWRYTRWVIGQQYSSANLVLLSPIKNCHYFNFYFFIKKFVWNCVNINCISRGDIFIYYHYSPQIQG